MSTSTCWCLILTREGSIFAYSVWWRNSFSAAPAMARPVPAPRQTLGEQNVAERAAVALQGAQLAPGFVGIAPAPLHERGRPGTNQCEHPVGRAHAERALGLAFGTMRFGRVDALD